MERKVFWQTALQFIKFGLVGISNTAVSYGVEMLCYYLLFNQVSWLETVRIGVTSVLAFAVSVTNSYYWNNRYVFCRDGKQTWQKHVKAYGKTVLCYGVTGLLFAPGMKVWLADMGMPYWLASLAVLVVTIPINFLLNKFWAFQDKPSKED